MSSTTRSPLSALEALSRDLAPRVSAVLGALVREHAEHARFLNMLSLMEHIGSRKIMATQSGTALDQETLKHLAEETRHALFFKRAAERVTGEALDYGTAATMAGPSARAYMGRLDAAIAAELDGDGGPLAYLYMSLIVELRAIWFYRLYAAALAEAHTPLSLKSVLAEEELHLDSMLRAIAEDPAHASRMDQFRAVEDARFRVLWKAIEAETARIKQAAE